MKKQRAVIMIIGIAAFIVAAIILSFSFKKDVMVNSIGMKFVKIPAGSFYMGSPQEEKDRQNNEGPQRKVKLTKSLYMGMYEVTQQEYEKVMGKNPSDFRGKRLPVERVYWFDAVSFCKKLTSSDPNFTYRLPTEAEWEYCCRAGSTTAFYWGDECDDAYGWNETNSSKKTHDVGKRSPMTGVVRYERQRLEW